MTTRIPNLKSRVTLEAMLASYIFIIRQDQLSILSNLRIFLESLE